MGVAETARQLDGALPESARRALSLLLEKPQETAKLSAAEVAARIGVHETTVTRLAKQLGYSGYRQLREALVNEGKEQLTSAYRVRSRGESGYSLAALVDDEVAAMQRLARVVSQQEVDDLAERILGARRTFLFGPPYAEAVLAVLARRVRRMGIDVVALPLSGRLIAEHLTALTAGDLVISFVFRLPDPKLGRINSYAQSVGAATVVIADEGGLLYEPRPDQIIVAPRGPSANQRSLIVPFVFSYALQFALTHLAEDRTVQALRRLDDIARVVGDDEPSHRA
jgi:DNA-binding MurR/RpiR family transcriptional regulator